MTYPRILRSLPALSLLCFLAPTLRAATPPKPTTPTTPASQPAALRIVLAGDSTVNKGGGWGSGFTARLTPDAECINLALNGRSSKSFIAEGQWKKCLAAKPNYVFIQFGHNDQPPKGPDRETIPQTTYKQYLTQYIEESRAAGATPILITSLSRRAWGEDGKIHSTLTPWVDAMKELGAEKQVPVIDLHAASIALYEKLGKEACDELSARTKDDKVDNTHLNAKGGEVIGGLVADLVKKNIPELAPHIK